MSIFKRYKHMNEISGASTFERAASIVAILMNYEINK